MMEISIIFANKNMKAKTIQAKIKIAARTKSHTRCASQMSIVIPIDWAFWLFCVVISTMTMTNVTIRMAGPKNTVSINVINPPKTTLRDQMVSEQLPMPH